MDYVYVVTKRETKAFVGVYSDTEAIPDAFMDDDASYLVQQVLVYGTEHSRMLVARGDVDPSMIRTY